MRETRKTSRTNAVRGTIRTANIIEKIKEHFRKKKISEENVLKMQLHFLFRNVYKFYFDLFRTKSHGVDVPQCIYDKECSSLAMTRAYEELLFRVADRKVVRNLWRRRLTELAGR